MSDDLMDLRTVLEKATSLTWSDALFMPPDRPRSLDTPCIVHDADDVEDDDLDLPNVAISHAFDYVIGIQTVQSIVENARLQKADASIDDLFNAFEYYLGHDAFITF